MSLMKSLFTNCAHPKGRFTQTAIHLKHPSYATVIGKKP